MAVMALIPGLFPTALLRAPAADPIRPDRPAPSPLTDAVVFSSAPFRILADVAAAGLRQLAALLPAMDRAVAEHDPAPLGHLAKAIGSAAKQVADGHAALLAAGPDRLAAALPDAPAHRASTPAPVAPALRMFVRQLGAGDDPAPSPRPNEALRAIARQLGADLPSIERDAPPSDPGERWLADAKHLLHESGETLDRASQALPASVAATIANPIAAEIALAQTRVAAAAATLDRVASGPRHQAAASVAALPVALGPAIALIGLVLVGSVLLLVGGAWFVGATVVTVAAALWWAARIGRATRGVTLDARR